MPKAYNDCPSDVVEKIRQQYNALQTDVNNLITKYNALVSLVNDMKSTFNAHTHDVTHAACSAESAVYGTSTGITSTSGPSTTVANGTTASLSAETVTR